MSKRGEDRVGLSVLDKEPVRIDTATCARCEYEGPRDEMVFGANNAPYCGDNCREQAAASDSYRLEHS